MSLKVILMATSLIQTIRITSVNSANQASDECRQSTSGSNNNNPYNNVNNNMTTPTISYMYLIKQYEVDKIYSLQCKRENPVLLYQLIVLTGHVLRRLDLSHMMHHRPLVRGNDYALISSAQ